MRENGRVGKCGRAILTQTHDDDDCPVQSFFQAAETSSFRVLGSGPASACKSVCADGAWQCGGELGMWTLQHTNPRRRLETPCKLSLSLSLSLSDPQSRANLHR